MKRQIEPTRFINIILGLDEDKKYLQQRINEWSESREVAVFVQVASADRSTDLVDQYVYELWKRPRLGMKSAKVNEDPAKASSRRVPLSHDMQVARYTQRLNEGNGKAMISGARNDSALTSAVLAHATYRDLVIAVPIYDEQFMGNPAFLANTQKNPNNPVFTMPIDGIETALEVAVRFADNRNGRMIKVVYDEKYIPFGSKVVDVLNRYGVPNQLKGPDKIHPDDIVITPLKPSEKRSRESVRAIDDVLKEGHGIQIVFKVPRGENGIFFEGYEEIFRGSYCATGFTSAGKPGFENSALIAAQIQRKNKVFEQFAAMGAKVAVDQIKIPQYEFPIEP